MVESRGKPLVSVVIPTYNREDYLIGTLDTLLKQDFESFEIIVIDSSENLSPKLERFLKEKNFRYYWVEKRGPHFAKNFGIKKAKGEIIIFCDDDIIASSNLVKNHVRNYNNPEIGGVAGRTYNKEEEKLERPRKIGKIPIHMEMTAGFHGDFRTYVDHVHGCNMSFRKRILERVGGFDENLIGNAIFEEADLSVRVRSLGYKIVFDPEAEVQHLQAEVGGVRTNEFIDWIYWRYHNFIYFILKNYGFKVLPFFLLRQTIRITTWIVKKRTFKVLLVALKGLVDGYKKYKSIKREKL